MLEGVVACQRPLITWETIRITPSYILQQKTLHRLERNRRSAWRSVLSQSLQVVCFSLRRLPYSSTSLSIWPHHHYSNLSLYTHHIHMFCYTTELSLSSPSHTFLFSILPPLKSNTDPRPLPENGLYSSIRACYIAGAHVHRCSSVDPHRSPGVINHALPTIKSFINSNVHRKHPPTLQDYPQHQCQYFPIIFIILSVANNIVIF